MKVIVSSLSRDFGGVESLFLSLVRCKNNSDLQFDFVCTDSSAAREEEFRKYGANVHHIERPSQGLRNYIRGFKRLFKTKQYAVYHVNMTRYRFPLDLVIAKLNGVKVILHCHATQIYDVGSRKVRIVRKVEQVLFKPICLWCSDLNLACSENAGRYLFGSHEFKVIHNGIDLNRFVYDACAREKIRSELELTGKKVIGHIGRFSQEKNHTYLLNILQELLKTDKDYRLLCAGNGDLFESVKEKAEAMGIGECIRFTGQRSDIPDLLSAMDVFVFPSIHEALPITLIEAQANGLPCVVSDCVTKEIDVNEDFYRLSLDKHASAWSDMVMKLFEKRKAVCNLDEFGDFDISTMKQKLNDLYLKLNHPGI